MERNHRSRNAGPQPPPESGHDAQHCEDPADQRAGCDVAGATVHCAAGVDLRADAAGVQDVLGGDLGGGDGEPADGEDVGGAADAGGKARDAAADRDHGGEERGDAPHRRALCAPARRVRAHRLPEQPPGHPRPRGAVAVRGHHPQGGRRDHGAGAARARSGVRVHTGHDHDQHGGLPRAPHQLLQPAQGDQPLVLPRALPHPRRRVQGAHRFHRVGD
mmetsp:Transcript_14687/g.30385  ORF Transcript_14687/g.30385 Transcript_14687/m.30385 type:complete len:218 (+) Transcript_14687:914-1567(+)